MKPTIQNFMPFENPNGAFGGGGKSSFQNPEENLFLEVHKINCLQNQLILCLP